MTSRQTRKGRSPITPEVPGASSLDAVLLPHEAAALLRRSTVTLQRWRSEGGGPAFVRINPRSVVYRRRDIDAWLASRIRRSTSDRGEAA